MKFDVGGNLHERSDRQVHQSGPQPLQTFQTRDMLEAHLDLGMGLAEG